MGANDGSGGGSLVTYYAKPIIADALGVSLKVIAIYHDLDLRTDYHLPEKAIRQIADKVSEASLRVVVTDEELVGINNLKELDRLVKIKMNEKDW